MIVDVIIPALDEAETLPLTLREIPRHAVRDVYVVDNGSRDETARRAVQAGALLLEEPLRGYGSACLRGVRHLATLERPPDVVAFLDGDYADDPHELPALLAPLESGAADLVIGSRTLGEREPGALALQQRFGNLLAVSLIRMIYGQRYTDLGPFRAIRLPALIALGMNDLGYGWTVEMQVKAAKAGLRIAEVPVRYRKRAGGASKISSTMRGVFGAGTKIIYTIFRHATAR
jgi:glycosyltransferase involved in cell wall biosynthesis